MQEKFNEYLDAAQKGDSKYKFIVGLLYEEGEVIDQDFNEAYKWYLEAIEEDHGFRSYAYFNLGMLLVKQDWATALDYFQLAGQLGYVGGYHNAAELLRANGKTDNERAKAWIYYAIAASMGFDRSAETLRKSGMPVPHIHDNSQLAVIGNLTEEVGRLKEELKDAANKPSPQQESDVADKESEVFKQLEEYMDKCKFLEDEMVLIKQGVNDKQAAYEFDCRALESEKERLSLLKKKLIKKEEQLSERAQAIQEKQPIAVSSQEAELLRQEKSQLEKERQELSREKENLQKAQQELINTEKELKQRKLKLDKIELAINEKAQQNEIELTQKQNEMEQAWIARETELRESKVKIDIDRERINHEREIQEQEEEKIKREKADLEKERGNFLNERARILAEKQNLISRQSTLTAQQIMEKKKIDEEIRVLSEKLQKREHELGIKERKLYERESQQKHIESELLKREQDVKQREHELEQQNEQLKVLKSEQAKAEKLILESQEKKRIAEKLVKDAELAQQRAEREKQNAERAEQAAKAAQERVEKQIQIAQKSGLSPLVSAIKDKSLQKVQSLLKEDNYDPNYQDSKGATGLHYAAKTGDMKIIALLIEYGAKPDIKDHAGKLPTDYVSKKEKYRAAADFLKEELRKVQQNKPLELLPKFVMGTADEEEKARLLKKIIEIKELDQGLAQFRQRSLETNLTQKNEIEDLYRLYHKVYDPLLRNNQIPDIYQTSMPTLQAKVKEMRDKCEHSFKVKQALAKQLGECEFKLNILQKKIKDPIDKKSLESLFGKKQASTLDEHRPMLVPQIEQEITRLKSSIQANVDIGAFYNELTKVAEDLVLLKKLTPEQLTQLAAKVAPPLKELENKKKLEKEAKPAAAKTEDKRLSSGSSQVKDAFFAKPAANLSPVPIVSIPLSIPSGQGSRLSPKAPSSKKP